MGRTVLVVMGILWVAFGVVCVVSPESVLSGIGIGLGTADALADARATYGGAQIGIGLLFLYCSREESRWRTGLIALALIAAGFGIARTLGIVVDGARGGPTFFALAVELLAVTLAWLSLARSGAAQRPVHA